MTLLKKSVIAIFVVVPLASALLALPHRVAAHKQLKQWRDAGYPTTIEELRERQSIPDEENGAQVIRRAIDVVDLTTYDANPIMGQGTLPEPDEPFAPETMEDMAKVIDANRETIDILYELMSYEELVISTVDNYWNGDNLTVMANLRNFVRMLEEKSLVAMENGESLQAVHDTELIWHMSYLHASSGNVDEVIYGTALIEMGLSNLAYMVNRYPLSEPSLHAYQKTLSEYTGINVDSDGVMANFVIEYNNWPGQLLPTLYGPEVPKYIGPPIRFVKWVWGWTPIDARGKRWIVEAHLQAQYLLQQDTYAMPAEGTLLYESPWGDGFDDSKYWILDIFPVFRTFNSGFRPKCDWPTSAWLWSGTK
jgi:hypothetical protein